MKFEQTQRPPNLQSDKRASITALRRLVRVSVLSALAALGCSREDPAAGLDASTTSAPATSAPPSAQPSRAAPSSSAAPVRAAELVLLAGGDASFGRLRGQRLLREPQRNDFANVQALLDAADVRFLNLECTISEQGGETQSPISQLVFTAPPPTAGALARAHINIVSLANNHAWDYGKSALLETLDRLDAVGVAYVGAGRAAAETYGPRIIEHNGFKLAFVAVTDIHNQADDPHPGRDLVADAAIDTLAASVKAAKATGADAVVVSHHGGYEYIDRPHPGTLALFDAAMAAGADVILGHHPHVIQRVGYHDGRPMFYSLGNLMMRMVTGKPWTQFGMFARLTFRRGEGIGVEVCPFRLHGLEPVPFAGDPQRESFEQLFRAKFDALLAFGERERPGTGAVMGELGADGCAPIQPRQPAPRTRSPTDAAPAAAR